MFLFFALPLAATLRRRASNLTGFFRYGLPFFVTKKGSEKSLAVPRQPLGGAQQAPPSRKAGPLVRYAQSPAPGATRPWEPQRGGRPTKKL